MSLFDADRQVSDLSHAPVKVGHQDAFAGVNLPRLVAGGNSQIAVGALPVDARNTSPVKDVSGFGNVPEISDSVVRPVTVDVVNYLGRILSVIKKPSYAMSKVMLVLDRDCDVPARAATPSNLSGSLVADDAGISLVDVKLVGNLWNRFNVSSHVESPLNVVRGLVTAITSTPILPQEVAA